MHNKIRSHQYIQAQSQHRDLNKHEEAQNKHGRKQAQHMQEQTKTSKRAISQH